MPGLLVQTYSALLPTRQHCCNGGCSPCISCDCCCDYCGLAAAMVAAHHAFPQNCCGLAAAEVAAHHPFAVCLLLRVGCFGCASPAGPPFLQSTQPVLFLFWLALQSFCALLLPSKTCLSRVCWCCHCSRAALPVVGCSSCFEVCLLFELLLLLLRFLRLLCISFVQAAFEEVQAYVEFLLCILTVNYVLISSLFSSTLYIS